MLTLDLNIEERERCALRDRQTRLRSVNIDFALGLPHSVRMPDGEEYPYGSFTKVHIRDREQESEIYRTCISAPPNKTVVGRFEEYCPTERGKSHCSSGLLRLCSAENIIVSGQHLCHNNKRNNNNSIGGSGGDNCAADNRNKKKNKNANNSSVNGGSNSKWCGNFPGSPLRRVATNVRRGTSHQNNSSCATKGLSKIVMVPCLTNHSCTSSSAVSASATLPSCTTQTTPSADTAVDSSSCSTTLLIPAPALLTPRGHISVLS